LNPKPYKNLISGDQAGSVAGEYRKNYIAMGAFVMVDVKGGM